MTKAERSLEKTRRQLKIVLETIDHLLEIERTHKPMPKQAKKIGTLVPALDVKSLLIQELHDCRSPIRIGHLVKKISKNACFYQTIYRTIKANDIFVRPKKGEVILRSVYMPKGPMEQESMQKTLELTKKDRQ